MLPHSGPEEVLLDLVAPLIRYAGLGLGPVAEHVPSQLEMMSRLLVLGELKIAALVRRVPLQSVGLGDDPERPLPVGVELLGLVQDDLVGNLALCRDDSQDDAALLLHIFARQGLHDVHSLLLLLLGLGVVVA